VHVIVTAARWAEIRPQLKDGINTRIDGFEDAADFVRLKATLF
jgi:hypothetical protein